MTRRGSRLGLTLGAAGCLAAIIGAWAATRPERRAAYAVRFSPQGDRVAAVAEIGSGGRGQLRVWDVATGRPVASVDLDDRPLSLAYSPDGGALAIGGWKGTVATWDPGSGRALRTFAGHSLPVRGLAFTPDGRRLVAGASDGRILGWDPSTGRELLRLDRGLRLPVNGLTISHDGRFLAAAGGLGVGAVSVWDLETARPLDLVSLVGVREPIAFADDRPVLAASATSPAGSVNLIDVEGDRDIANIRIGRARSIALSDDARLVAAGDDDGIIAIREAETGRPVASRGGPRRSRETLGDHLHDKLADVGLAEPRDREIAWSVAFSPDGTRLASAGEDGLVRLWGIPGRAATVPPDRILWPLPSRPGWLPVVQVSLALAAVLLVAMAFSSRRKKSSDVSCPQPQGAEG